MIENYVISRALDRGFYGATYVAETKGVLTRVCVLKVIPRAVYSFFQKDFTAECRLHHEVAGGTDHVVPILHAFDAPVDFAERVIDCHITELEYVKGHRLFDVLQAEEPIPAPRIAQIAIDLLRLRHELESRGVYHNDLHDKNVIIENLPAERRRLDAVDRTVKARAIDLGSVHDASRSAGGRGDLRQIAAHIQRLSEKLLARPEQTDDLDYRLAGALEEIIHTLSASGSSQRTSATDMIRSIEDAVERVSAPWSESLRLRTMSDSYNAQTLAPWFIPLLIVDPDDQWLKAISVHGPQVITGMRGCGKTMLLRSVEYHARAAKHEGDTEDDVMARLKKDNFVGLYVSAQRLLDPHTDEQASPSDAFVRLYVGYGLAALTAFSHLRSIAPNLTPPYAFRRLAEALDAYIDPHPGLAGATSELDLRRRLTSLSVELNRAGSPHQLHGHPSAAFPHLAEAIRSMSPLWETAQILYLLDDVSTRYLNSERIGRLFSSLLIQHDVCSFKITSEAQTIHLVLRSPGEIEKARLGRDYDYFDLGAEVYKRIKKKGFSGGVHFVEDILSRRARYLPRHPSVRPSTLLGDASLEQIAEDIAQAKKGSANRKSVYHGIRALAGACVGDIGDVLSLYQLILAKSDLKTIPVPAKDQSECFQEFCSHRLYDLHRRDKDIRQFATSFAEASHQLLLQSSAQPRGARGLRQYLSVYVRITSGNKASQTERLRELVDAGLFVFAGGTSAPRTKTDDSDPMQQFKLTFRKIYGIANFIGLSERDRFELSGEDLESWLTRPEDGKEILLRNLVKDRDEDSELDDDEPDDQIAANEDHQEAQPSRTSRTGFSAIEQMHLFDVSSSAKGAVPEAGEATALGLIREFVPSAEEVSLKDLSSAGINTVLLGLGFEERTPESAARILKGFRPRSVTLIQYPDPGYEKKIRSLVDSVGVPSATLSYQIHKRSGIPAQEGKTLIDVTGIAKPILFSAVRNQLLRDGEVWLAHTRATEYYPRDEDLEPVLRANDEMDPFRFLERLDHVLTGEIGPYQTFSLLESTADESRKRLLFAFASPRHERLLKLLEREYDRAEIIVHRSASRRTQVSRIVAEVAAKSFQNADINEVDSDDLKGFVELMAKKYVKWYVDSGFNFELGLTGSKMHAAACAALSTALKIAQVWYVSPERYDKSRYTTGVSASKYYHIRLPRR